jgi:hypothetical protein
VTLPPNPSPSLSAALWGGDGNAGGEATMARHGGGEVAGRRQRRVGWGGDSNGSGGDLGRSSRYG